MLVVKYVKKSMSKKLTIKSCISKFQVIEWIGYKASSNYSF